MIAKRDGIFIPIGGQMKKKYSPKYYPTRIEDFTDDELSHIMKNIREYENRKQLIKIMPYAVVLASVIIYLLVR